MTQETEAPPAEFTAKVCDYVNQLRRDGSQVGTPSYHRVNAMEAGSYDSSMHDESEDDGDTDQHLTWMAKFIVDGEEEEFHDN